MTAQQVRAALADIADPADAVTLRRYFKTCPGEYGEGDVFIGVRAPAIRVVAKLPDLAVEQIDALLDSPIHEHRLTALIILNGRFAKAAKRSDEGTQARMVELYPAALRRGRIDNWDLIDGSAENVIGPWLFDRPRDLLFELAASDSRCQRRVALLSGFAFIKRGDASTTPALCERLLPERIDLIGESRRLDAA